MKKVAVCIGLNLYPDPKNNLKGCVNDATDWASYLKNKQGATDVSIVTDSNVKVAPVTKLILSKAKTCVAGDHFVLTNSSHGSSIPDRTNDEIDGRDEVLCWYDNFLLDDTIRTIINSIVPGVNITIISDSCHSGSVTRMFVPEKENKGYKTIKFIQPKDPEFAAKVNSLPVRKRSVSTGISEEQMREILISGCKSNEYSYDAYIKRRYNGAFTRACLDILYGSDNLTYNQFYQKLVKKLPCSNFPQSPQLEGNSANKNKIMFS
jgi:hypothetical protein